MLEVKLTVLIAIVSTVSDMMSVSASQTRDCEFKFRPSSSNVEPEFQQRQRREEKKHGGRRMTAY